MKRLLYFLLFFTLLFTLISFTSKRQSAAHEFTEFSKVNDVLFALGEPKPKWYPSDLSEEKIKIGKDLVFKGRSVDPDGKQSDYISVYYMCTSCHNTVQEDPVLTVSNAQARLDYADEKNLPFLQGTSFRGITNRESWYNDDYYKKYGDLVEPASDDLREAVQLCATQCAQGRLLEDWELQAIMAYYYSISYTMEEIGFTDANMQKFNNAIADGETGLKQRYIADIKDKYLLKSPATFLEPPYDVYWEKYNGKGDPENGEKIYRLSCQACHNSYGVSAVVLGDTRQDFKAMGRWFKKNEWWLHQVVRHGTHPVPGHLPYMPLYTEERMDDQMIEDLKAFILKSGEKNS